METTLDGGREERGRAMAGTKKIRRKDGLWLVPSATTATRYTVDLADENGPTCTCPDWELRQSKCKHIHAVEFTIIRETAPDGTVTETRSVKITYKQDWPAYNAAQVNEQERVEALLRGLCDGIALALPKLVVRARARRAFLGGDVHHVGSRVRRRRNEPQMTLSADLLRVGHRPASFFASTVESRRVVHIANVYLSAMRVKRLDKDSARYTVDHMKRRKTKADRREASILIRVTDEQKETLSAAAKKAGLDLSGWIRALALKEAGAGA